MSPHDTVLVHKYLYYVVARRLELDRAALMEALELCRATLSKLHASFSTPEEWQALWPAIKSAKATLATAHENFPEP